jgi:hypothetical protein
MQNAEAYLELIRERGKIKLTEVKALQKGKTAILESRMP